MMNSSSTGIWTYQCLPQHLSGIQDLFWISFHTSCSCCLSWHTVYMTGVHRVNGLDPPKLPHTLNNWMARAAGCRFINKWHISSARCFSGHRGTIFSESDFTEAASANVQLNNTNCFTIFVQRPFGSDWTWYRCPGWKVLDGCEDNQKPPVILIRLFI